MKTSVNMKTSLDPQEFFRTYGICIEQLPVIEHIWRNRNTKNFVSVRLNKLSKSKMVRQANFSIEYNGEKYMLDRLIASLSGLKLKDGSVKIIGCGQDMFSAALYDFLNHCRNIVIGLNMPLEINGDYERLAIIAFFYFHKQ